MKNVLRISVILALVVSGLIATSALAFAAPPEKVNGFVCPVLGGQAGMHGMHKGVTPIAGGYYTHGGPDVTVPAQVTNTGFPSVAGSFLTPGDPGYGAIWDYANAP